MEEADRGEAEELTELLRRCHRDELLPLAVVLRVNPNGLGLLELARAITKTLRRRGGNGMGNILVRKGEGPGYPELVAALATRLGVSAEGSAADVELSIVSLQVEQGWSALSDRQRDELWSDLDMPLPAPASGTEVTTLTEGSDQRAYMLGVTVLGGITRMAMLTPLAPLAGCVAMFWIARPNDAVVLPGVLHVARLRQLVRHRITIGVVGSPSSGKDAAIKAIFGVDSGNVNPVAGSTTEVEITKLPGATALYVVNTPGLGDVIESVTREAQQVLGLIDLYIYVVNAQGGVQARELDDYRRCVASGRPVAAVVNKIDTIRPSELDRYLADAADKLGVADEDFFPVAFDPLPQLSETPIQVAPLREWLRRHLTKQGKQPGELLSLDDD